VFKKSLIVLITSILLILQACGGGGGGGESSPETAMKVLEWLPPSTRVDGKYLPPTAIAGYHLYFGEDIDNLQLVTDIEDMSIDSYTFEAPDAGNYYFGITVYDRHGLESEMSNIVYK